MTTQNHSNSSYISNPFTLMFKGFGHMYNINQNMTIVLLVLSALSSFGYGGGSGGSAPSGIGDAGGELSSAAITAIIIIVSFLVITGVVVGTFIWTMFTGMAAHVAWNTAQNKTVTFEESFKAVIKKFWRIVLINLIVFLKVLGGTFLFIVPGIRAALRYQMVLMPVFESDADHKQAIATSKAITKGHLIEVFGLSVAGGIIPLVGEALKIGGQSIMYPQLKHLHDSGAEKPKVHWLNYLGFILFAGIFLFFGFLTLIVIAAVKGL